jgi:hypothetical protein
LRVKIARYFSGPRDNLEEDEMERHIEQALARSGSKAFGIIEKLGWSNRKLAGRFSLPSPNVVPRSSTTSQTAKELREFQAEFECKRAQGLIEAERYRNMLLR